MSVFCFWKLLVFFKQLLNKKTTYVGGKDDWNTPSKQRVEQKSFKLFVPTHFTGRSHCPKHKNQYKYEVIFLRLKSNIKSHLKLDQISNDITLCQQTADKNAK